MRCDTCKKDAAVVQRVVIAKGYNRSLARPMYNCPECFEKKERSKTVHPASGQKEQQR
jgi:hypothetical protein